MQAEYRPLNYKLKENVQVWGFRKCLQERTRSGNGDQLQQLQHRQSANSPRGHDATGIEREEAAVVAVPGSINVQSVADLLAFESHYIGYPCRVDHESHGCRLLQLRVMYICTKWIMSHIVCRLSTGLFPSYFLQQCSLATSVCTVPRQKGSSLKASGAFAHSRTGRISDKKCDNDHGN